MSMLSLDQKRQVIEFIKDVQTRLGAAFEQVDGEAVLQRKSWQREQTFTQSQDLGHPNGGTMGVLRGKVVEKAGVNVSVVQGDSYPSLESEFKGKPFMAAGVSTICHMYNPHAPIGHMNVRLLEVGETFWVGGGADLTPFIKYQEDRDEFHAILKKSCEENYERGSYEKFSKWCDEYFYIPHRQEIRGVGGVFFDYIKTDFNVAFQLIRSVANAYVEVFPKILQRRKDIPFTELEKDQQLFWRGRYAEFNLIYDRGTKFGLMSGGNTEAIFVSLPPVVKW